MQTMLIKNCLVVPMSEDESAENPWFAGEITVTGDLIRDVGVPGSQKGKFDKVIDAGGKAVLPGLINTHTHAAMSLFRGYADDLPLKQWLEEKIWPIEARLTAEDVYWGSLLAIAEMLLSGTTTFSDMYFHMPSVARAVDETGIRAVLAYGMTALGPDPEKELSRGVSFAREFNGGADGRIITALGPHAPYTCPPDFIQKVIQAAGESGSLVHIHLAETLGEVEDMVRTYGKRPVELMAELGLFQVPVLAAHCVHLSQKEITLLYEGQAAVAHNPESNMKLASGIAPVPDLLARGVTVGLGTDGAASNNDLSLWGEMRSAALVHKVNTLDPTAISAYQALKMATSLGARALGLGDRLGTIQPGKKADLVMVDLDRPHLYPHHDLIAHLVYSARPEDVDTVIIDGRMVVENKRLLVMDLAEVENEVETRAKRLVRQER